MLMPDFSSSVVFRVVGDDVVAEGDEVVEGEEYCQTLCLQVQMAQGRTMMYVVVVLPLLYLSLIVRQI